MLAKIQREFNPNFGPRENRRDEFKNWPKMERGPRCQRELSSIKATRRQDCPRPAHELGRADLLVGLDAPQRVPTWFIAPMRD